MKNVNKIRIDDNDLVVAYGPFADGIIPTDSLPDDFHSTSGTNKYKYINGLFIEVEGWVLPPPQINNL